MIFHRPNNWLINYWWNDWQIIHLALPWIRLDNKACDGGVSNPTPSFTCWYDNVVLFTCYLNIIWLTALQRAHMFEAFWSPSNGLIDSPYSFAIKPKIHALWKRPGWLADFQAKQTELITSSYFDLSISARWLKELSLSLWLMYTKDTHWTGLPRPLSLRSKQSA